MLAHFCREGLFEQEIQGINTSEKTRVLPVLHNYFDVILDKVDDSKILVESHLEEIIKKAIYEIVKFLQFPDIVEGIRKLDFLQRLKLQVLLIVYSDYLEAPDYDLARDVLGREIIFENGQISIEMINPRELGFIQSASPPRSTIKLNRDEIALLLAKYIQTSPKNQLRYFADLFKVDWNSCSLYTN